MQIYNTRMSEEKEGTWKKVYEIKTKAKTRKGIAKAIEKHTDFFFGLSEDEKESFLDSEYVHLHKDGVIIWEA